MILILPFHAFFSVTIKLFNCNYRRIASVSAFHAKATKRREPYARLFSYREVLKPHLGFLGLSGNVVGEFKKKSVVSVLSSKLNLLFRRCVFGKCTLYNVVIFVHSSKKSGMVSRITIRSCQTSLNL